MNQAWDIRPEIVVKFFKKCGINNSFNGMEDDTLFNDNDSSIENEY